MKKAGQLWKIFFSTLYLSAFTFGGGYVIITLLKQKFVDDLHWIDEEEMLDLVAIAQSSPGPIAVNGAVAVGYKLAGLPGILTAVAGAILPPFVILTLISLFYTAFRDNSVIQALLRGMRAGVCAVILSVVCDMTFGMMKARDWVLIPMMLTAFAANYFFHVSAVWIILTAALLGVLRTVLRAKRGGASA